SPSSPAADPTEDGDVTLQCSLERFNWISFCPKNSLLWLDERGTVLTGEGVGYQFRQTGCDSYLTVKLHNSSRRYTCQFVEGNTVKIEAHYQLEEHFRSSTGFPDWSPLSFIMLTLKITALILMVGITADIIRTRGRKKPQKDIDTNLKWYTCSGTFHWLNEKGTKLTGKDDRYKINKPGSCVSSLTVQHQSVTNRRYTCQFVEGNSVKVEAHYPAVLKGIKREGVHIYHRAGDDAVLPCKRPSSSSSSCSTVNWLYMRDEDMNPQQEVQRGNIVQSSSKAARLSVDNNCSLIINSITAEDAGGYRCQIQDGGSSDPDVYLNLMSISPVEADPRGNKITLLCSLLRFSSLGPCPENSLLWVDETGTGLTGEGVGYQFRQTGCDSNLTVKLQSSSSRRYTCQFVDGNTVKIEAHYQLEGFPDWSPLSFIMLTLRITALILMVGITADIIRTRGRKKPQKDIDVHDAVGDDTVHYQNDGEYSASATIS
ncbi:PREDICTED: uncharacterized protein LOC107102495, partial [Cyprinodon variegatus]|uniref:uncharacterized protein LOC107102495 n=1 Tax=Cyprinodon variegatus TaxID=28743 RepID=UPI00074290DA